MSDVFALHEPPAPVLVDALAAAPYTILERWELSHEAQQATARSFPAERNYRLEFDRAAEAFRQQGVTLDNPYTDLAGPYASGTVNVLTGRTSAAVEAERARRLAAWDAAAQRLQTENPDALDTFPNSAALRLSADARARATARDNQAAEDQGGGIGAFMGTVTGAMQDPVQALTLTVGAPWRAVTGGASLLAQVGRTAALEGAIGAGTQALIETSAAPYRARLGVEGDALNSILGAAIGGAVLGGGLRGVVGAFELRGVRARAEAANATPADIRAADAATLAQTRLDELAGNPAGPEGVAAHEAALDQAVADVAAGRPARSLSAATTDPRRVPLIPAVPGDAATRAEIEAMIASRENRSWGLTFGKVQPDEAARTQAAANLDILGFERVMNLDEVRHAWRRHGEDGADIRVRPLTLDDLAMAPEWVRTADNVSQDGVTHQGLPVLRYTKRLPDGELVIIEHVRTRRQQMAFLTMYFQRGDGPAAQASPSGVGPPPARRPKREAGTVRPDLSPSLARFNTFTPVGRAVLVEPQVVELDTLVPSHLDDGSLNPAYPHAEGVQPRDRGAAPSRDQVRAIAAGLIPERLGPNVEAGLGAPIVADDLVVESGNGRVAALRLVFSDPALAEVAASYRAFLGRQGHDVTGLQNPVLVSRRVSALSPEERRAFVAESNGRATLAQAVGERARADAGRLDDALPLFRGGDVDSADNAPFVRAFLGALSPEERGSLITRDGRLSAEGAARLRAAVLARAYGDEMGPLLDRLLEGQTDGLRAVAGALTDVSARWAQLRQAVRAGEVDAPMDATADLIGALRTLDEARRLKLSVPELLVQGDLDRPPLTPAALKFLGAFFDRADYTGRTPARASIAARLDAYVAEAMKVRPGLDLFGTPPLRPDQIMEGARLTEAPAAPTPPPAASGAPEAAARWPVLDFAQEAQNRLSARQRALRDAAEERAATRPPPERIIPVELHEARRIAAAEDVPVPDGLPDGTGPQPTRGARDLLDEAEAEIDLATQAAACLIGGAA